MGKPGVRRKDEVLIPGIDGATGADVPGVGGNDGGFMPDTEGVPEIEGTFPTCGVLWIIGTVLAS